MKQFNEQRIDHILELISQNRKIEAVKFVVEHSNLGLKEAKDFVELLQDDPNIEPHSIAYLG